MRVVSRITPAPLVWSLMASTWAVWGKTSRTLPTMPSAVMTALSRCSPSADALVDVEDAGLVAAAGTDGLCGNRLVDVFLLEAVERLETLALVGVFKQCRLLEAETVDGFLQVLVLLAHMAQIDVVLPEVFDAEFGGVNEFFRRGDDRIGPQADEADTRPIAGIEGAVAPAGAPHLHCEADDLREQDSQQHQNISIADEDGFHKNRD